MSDKPLDPPEWDPDRLKKLIQDRARAIAEANKRNKVNPNIQILHTLNPGDSTPRLFIAKAMTEVMAAATIKFTDRVNGIPEGEKDTPVSWDNLKELLGEESIDNIKSD